MDTTRVVATRRRGKRLGLCRHVPRLILRPPVLNRDAPGLAPTLNADSSALEKQCQTSEIFAAKKP